jgi:hypothetical protein
MDASVFAEWFRRQGYHVVKTESSYWFDQGPRVYQAIPYHWIIQPSEGEIQDFLVKHKVVGLRYSTNFQAEKGAVSYHAVYSGNGYTLNSLEKCTRKNVRRGLRNCRVEPISFKRLAEEGLPLQLDTLNRQARRVRINQKTWTRLCMTAADLPGFTAWGALVDSKLAASVITFQLEDTGYLLYQQCDRNYLPCRVNNALAFVVTQAMLASPGIHSILYGLHSLDAPPSVDEFKFRMGYTPRLVRQRVVFHPWLSPLVNPLTYSIVGSLNHLWRGYQMLTKAGGMLRFYLEGQRPIEEQSWPEALWAQRQMFLNSDG